MDISKVTTHSLQNTKKLTKTNKTDEKFTVEENIATNKSPVNSAITLSPIDALFLNLEQRRKGHRQAIEKSDKILNQLDGLRVEIISGNVSKETLTNIASLLQNHSQAVAEEPLRSLILEVETRAKVELAKLEK